MNLRSRLQGEEADQELLGVLELPVDELLRHSMALNVELQWSNANSSCMLGLNRWVRMTDKNNWEKPKCTDLGPYKANFTGGVVQLLGNLMLPLLEVREIHNQDLPRDLAIADTLSS